MEHLDRVSHRVSLCALTGLVSGAGYATYKGLPLQSTAIKIASSCAIVGTSLFGAERLGYFALRDQIDSERRLTLTSHAFAGLFGGGMNGYMYQKKPLRGMFFFLPIMMGVGFLEMAWEQKRQERIQEVFNETESRRSDQDINDKAPSNS